MFTSGNNWSNNQLFSVQAKLVNFLLGKSVVDTYGRQVGFLMGYSVDQSGEISSIGIDRGTEGFEEFESDRFRFENDTVVVTPRWESESQGMGENMGDVHRRLASLKQLAKQLGVPRSKVDQMIKKTDKDLYAFLQSHKLLAERMALRGFEIESQTEDLDEFVTNLTVQYNNGSIEQATYEATMEYCRAVRTRNLREVDDLCKTLKALANQGQAKIMGRLGKDMEESEPESVKQAGGRRPQLIAEMP